MRESSHPPTKFLFRNTLSFSWSGEEVSSTNSSTPQTCNQCLRNSRYGPFVVTGPMVAIFYQVHHFTIQCGKKTNSTLVEWWQESGISCFPVYRTYCRILLKSFIVCNELFTHLLPLSLKSFLYACMDDTKPQLKMF